MDTVTWLASTLPTLALAAASVEAVRDAAVRAGASGAVVSAPLDQRRIAAAFSSERLFRDGTATASAFAPLSGFFRADDGWVRTHANYPHHRERLLRVLGLSDADRADAARAIERRSSGALEDEAAEAGAIVVRVRAEVEWRASPQGTAAAQGPLVRTTAREDVAAPAVLGGPLPLFGIRVLDFTRVLAGPVCTRTLSLFGADVLRLDPPVPAEIVWQHLDTGQGKRTALLDLRTDLDQAQELLDVADVLVTGYRPGSIEAFGLRTPPGAVHARINAWGDAGPWRQRRGFDSIVQAASGIALLESGDGETPGALPAQALDHGTGYFLAAAIIDALAARAQDGLGRDVSAALARTATALLDAPGRDPGHSVALTPGPESTVTHGTVTTAAPAIPGFHDFPHPAHRWGSDAPSFD